MTLTEDASGHLLVRSLGSVDGVPVDMVVGKIEICQGRVPSATLHIPDRTIPLASGGTITYRAAGTHRTVPEALAALRAMLELARPLGVALGE